MIDGDPEKTTKKQIDINSSDREVSFEPNKSDETGLIKDKSQVVKKQGVESLHQAQTVHYPSLANDGHTCPAVDEDPNAVDESPVVNDLRSNGDDTKQPGSVISQGVDDIPSANVDDLSVTANDDPSLFVV